MYFDSKRRKRDSGSKIFAHTVIIRENLRDVYKYTFQVRAYVHRWDEKIIGRVTFTTL